MRHTLKKNGLRLICRKGRRGVDINTLWFARRRSPALVCVDLETKAQAVVVPDGAGWAVALKSRHDEPSVLVGHAPRRILARRMAERALAEERYMFYTYSLGIGGLAAMMVGHLSVVSAYAAQLGGHLGTR